MKKDSIEVELMFSTQFKRKTLCKSKYVHSEKHAKIEDVNVIVQQAVTNTRKYMFIIENHVVSEHDKRWKYNEKVIFQRWFIITSQKMQSHDKDNKQRRNKENVKENH